MALMKKAGMRERDSETCSKGPRLESNLSEDSAVTGELLEHTVLYLTHHNQLWTPPLTLWLVNTKKAEQPTIQRGGRVVGRGVESVQHLFTPGGKAILRLHALQQLQQLLLLICPFTTHHVLIAVEDRQGSTHIKYVHQLKDIIWFYLPQ